MVKLGKGLIKNDIRKAQRIARKHLKEARFGIVMGDQGIGKGSDGVIVLFHENLQSYMNLRNRLRELGFLGISNIEFFLISIHDEVHYGSLTFLTLAKHLLTLKGVRKDE